MDDEQLLAAWLEADAVRLRISMFTVMFLLRVGLSAKVLAAFFSRAMNNARLR